MPPHDSALTPTVRIPISIVTVVDSACHASGATLPPDLLSAMSATALSPAADTDAITSDDYAMLVSSEHLRLVLGATVDAAGVPVVIFVVTQISSVGELHRVAQLYDAAIERLRSLLVDYDRTVRQLVIGRRFEALDRMIRRPDFSVHLSPEPRNATLHLLTLTRGHSGIVGVATDRLLCLGANVVDTLGKISIPSTDARLAYNRQRDQYTLQIANPDVIRALSRQGRPPTRTLLMIVSVAIRSGPRSPFLQLLRRYAYSLHDFAIVATDGTAATIRTAGISEVAALRPGRSGGVIEAAGRVATGRVDVAVLLLDPTSPTYGLPENGTLQHLMRLRQKPMLTSLGDLEEWLAEQAALSADQTLGPQSAPEDASTAPFAPAMTSSPGLFTEGERNVDSSGQRIFLRLSQTVLAVTAHDTRKEALVSKLAQHLEFLAGLDRLLVTEGTSRRLTAALEAQIDRGAELGSDDFGGPAALAQRVLSRIHTLPGGTSGGCVLVANAVLDHMCHAVFALPSTKGDALDDVHASLLERVCRYTDGGGGHHAVHATYIDTEDGFDRWVSRSTRRQSGDMTPAALAAEVQRFYGLRDLIVVAHEDEEDSPQLGASLARAAAGYVHEWLRERIQENTEFRVGVSHGYTMSRLAEALSSLVEDARRRGERLSARKARWLVVGGNIYATSQASDAVVIARVLQRAYGGDVDAISCPPMIDPSAPKELRESAETARVTARGADLLLAAVGPWPSVGAPSLIDQVRASEGIGVISTAVFGTRGREVLATPAPVGLGIADIRQMVRSHQSRAGSRPQDVLAICGGKARTNAVEALLQGGLASVLVTTMATVQELANRLPTRAQRTA